MSSDPQHVRPHGGEVTVDQILREVVGVGAASGGFLHPSADPANAFADHDPFHGAAGDVAKCSFADDLGPQFPRAAAGVVVGVDAAQGLGDLVAKPRVLYRVEQLAGPGTGRET